MTAKVIDFQKQKEFKALQEIKKLINPMSPEFVFDPINFGVIAINSYKESKEDK